MVDGFVGLATHVAPTAVVRDTGSDLLAASDPWSSTHASATLAFSCPSLFASLLQMGDTPAPLPFTALLLGAFAVGMRLAIAPLLGSNLLAIGLAIPPTLLGVLRGVLPVSPPGSRTLPRDEGWSGPIATRLALPHAGSAVATRRPA